MAVGFLKFIEIPYFSFIDSKEFALIVCFFLTEKADFAVWIKI